MFTRQTQGLIAFGAAGISVLLVGGFSAGAAPDYYAGWAAGDLWDGYGTILRSTDSRNRWARQGAGQIAEVLWIHQATVSQHITYALKKLRYICKPLNCLTPLNEFL